MTQSAGHESPRHWMAAYFRKNSASLEGRSRGREAIDWRNPSALPGVICLGPIADAIISFGAREPVAAGRFLERGDWVLHQAVDLFGEASDRDAIDFDRPCIALASRLGAVLAPDVFGEPWPVPFDAFRRYIEADGRLLEETNAGRVLWALDAVLEGEAAEYDAARSLKVRSHRDLRDEMALVPSLWDLSRDPQHPQWAEYERILARWLNPLLRTTSYASNFQDMMAGLLALIWAKSRLGRLDRETLLATYFGETLSIPVPVE